MAYDNSINEFFKALESRDFDQTDAVVRKLGALASEENEYSLWAEYFSGILEQEKNNDWAKAEIIFNKVLCQRPTKVIEALVHLSRSIAYQRLGRWESCLEAANESAQLWSELDQPLRKATAFRQVGVACVGGYLAGDFSSEVLEQGSISCSEAIALLESPDITSSDTGLYEFDRELYKAITHEALGTIENCRNNFEQAKSHFQCYLNIATGRKEKFHIALASSHLGRTIHLSGQNHQEALALYEKSINIFHKMQENLFEFHTLAAKGTLYRKSGMPKQAISCYDRSLYLLESVRNGISSESARRDFLSKVVNIHDNAILAELSIGNPLLALKNAEQSRSRTFVDALSQKESIKLDGNLHDFIDVDSLEGLPSDSVVLEFHCLGLLQGNGGQSSQLQASIDVLYPGPKAILFVANNNSIEARELEVDPNHLLPRNFDKLIEARFLSSQIRQTLYDKLVAPVAHLLEGKRRVYIIPHGPLHYVPFHALIAPDGETLLREGGPEIVYAPSASILFRELQKKEEPAHDSSLAVGYNGDEGSELHFAEQEASYISDMTQGAALVGPTSKKEALYEQAPKYNSLHFSCHGEFDPEVPLESLLHIGPGETLTGQEIIDNLQLNCDLVTLSACESGLSKVQRGDELYGLIRAFMYAGAPAILATLWRVDERSTLIFAEKFYSLVQEGVPYTTAMKEAQLYLKNLTRKEAMEVLTRHLANVETVADSSALLDEADKYLKGLNSTTSAPTYELVPDSEDLPDDDDKVFADPKYWAPFVLIGDPQIHSDR